MITTEQICENDDPSMHNYDNLMAAMLSIRIKDLQNKRTTPGVLYNKEMAKWWLLNEPFCKEICERLSIDYDLMIQKARPYFPVQVDNGTPI